MKNEKAGKTGKATGSPVENSGEGEKVKEIQSREGMIQVSSTLLGKTKAKAEKIQVRPFAVEPAYVSVKMGKTINMGDYNSARVDVMVSCPCYKEEIVPVYKQVKELVDHLIEEVSEELEGGGSVEVGETDDDSIPF